MGMELKPSSAARFAVINLPVILDAVSYMVSCIRNADAHGFLHIEILIEDGYVLKSMGSHLRRANYSIG